jgi:hypothetical protein
MDDITMVEACAALEIDPEAARLVMSGPFAPSAAGLLDVRQTLGAAVVLALPMLSGAEAVAIALSAATQAQTGAPARLLGVGWKRNGGSPVGCWLSDPVPTNVNTILMILPADRMLADLAGRIAEHRAAALRPN